MLEAARAFVSDESLDNVEFVEDDLFASALEPASFDLVHARFQLAPLGRFGEQMAAYRKMVKPGGLLVLEEPDMSSWRFNPDAPAAQRLIGLIERAFLTSGGDFNSGRRFPELLGDNAELVAEIVALPPGHAYLRLPLQFAASLEPKLLDLIGHDELARLRVEAETEIAAPSPGERPSPSSRPGVAPDRSARDGRHRPEPTAHPAPSPFSRPDGRHAAARLIAPSGPERNRTARARPAR